MGLVVSKTDESWVNDTADYIEGMITGSIVARGRAIVALSGGGTPRPVYERLAECDLDWGLVTFYFSDERAVPPDHPSSNYRMADESLFQRLKRRPGGICRIRAEAGSETAADEYEKTVPPRFDVILLGMGGDGHIASLFPGSPALSEYERLVVASKAPVEPHDRVTLTPRALQDAVAVAVIVRGKEKASMMEQIIRGPEQINTLPAQLVRKRTWLIDPAAVSVIDA